MDPEVSGAFIKQCRHELCIRQSELADALGITIVELMQSKRIEADIPKEEAAEMVSSTVDTLRHQEKLSRNRDLITFFGTLPIAMAVVQEVAVRRAVRGCLTGAACLFCGVWILAEGSSWLDMLFCCF